MLLLGPHKLPDAAKSLGKALRDFRRAGDDLKREMMGDLDAPPPPPVALQKPAESVSTKPIAEDEASKPQNG